MATSPTMAERVCSQCRAAPGTLVCARCKARYYCGRACQKRDWRRHKPTCTPPPPPGAQTPGPAAPSTPQGRQGDQAEATETAVPSPGRGGLVFASASPKLGVLAAAAGLGREARGRRRLLVLLHGRGDSEETYLRLGQRMELPETTVLSVRGPLPLPLGLPGHFWFETLDAQGAFIAGTKGEGRRWRSLSQGTRPLVHAFLDRLFGHGFEPDKTVVVGFGQGGLVAVDAALSYPRGQLAGVVGVESGLALPELDAAEALLPALQQAGTPVLLRHGARNRELPAAQVEGQVRALSRHLPHLQLSISKEGTGAMRLLPADTRCVYPFLDACFLASRRAPVSDVVELDAAAFLNGRVVERAAPTK